MVFLESIIAKLRHVETEHSTSKRLIETKANKTKQNKNKTKQKRNKTKNSHVKFQQWSQNIRPVNRLTIQIQNSLPYRPSMFR